MDNRTAQFPSLAVLAAALLGLSCVTAPARPQNVLDEAPAWVVRGGGCSSGAAGKVFLGVGRSTGAPTEVSRREETENRARGDLTSVLSAYVAGFVKSYNSGTPPPSDGQAIADALKAFVAQQTATAPIQDRWISKDGSTEFAETQLELESLKENLLQVQALNDRMREIIKERAAQTFDALSKPDPQNALQP